MYSTYTDSNGKPYCTSSVSFDPLSNWVYNSYTHTDHYAVDDVCPVQPLRRPGGPAGRLGHPVRGDGVDGVVHPDRVRVAGGVRRELSRTAGGCTAVELHE